jgi:ribonuclease BN (tRNA processing enzyme)
MGHGSFDQFENSGLGIGKLDNIFITHLHLDHITDLYTMLWLRFGGFNSLAHAVNVYGPGPAGALPAPSIPGATVTIVNPSTRRRGLADLMNAQIAATAYDVNIRMLDEGWPSIYDRVRLNEIALPDVGASAPDNLTPPMQPLPVMSDDRVQVSAILVKHPPVFPSYAFRFDTAHGSVVFSGDTTVTPNMVTLARDADLLVHEGIDLQAVQMAGRFSEAQIRHLEASHTDVTKVGGVAQAAGVKTSCSAT